MLSGQAGGPMTVSLKTVLTLLLGALFCLQAWLTVTKYLEGKTNLQVSGEVQTKDTLHILIHSTCSTAGDTDGHGGDPLPLSDLLQEVHLRPELRRAGPAAGGGGGGGGGEGLGAAAHRQQGDHVQAAEPRHPPHRQHLPLHHHRGARSRQPLLLPIRVPGL